MPFVMENVKGIMMMVKNAGTASIISSQSICFDCDIIMAPMSIRTGAVAVCGILAKSGAKNTDIKNKILTTIPVSPVRPPSVMPAADSMYTMTGVHPRLAAAMDPADAAIKTALDPGTPASINPQGATWVSG